MGEVGRERLLGAVCCGLVVAAGLSAAKPQEIRFTVTDQTVHQIDPRMFGQFMERPSWGEIGVEGALVPGTNRLQPKVRELLEAMEVPVIRFPGGKDVAMSSGMGRGSVFAVKPGGSGDVTESRRLWQADIKKSRTGSGIIHEGHFYNISDNGIADYEDLETGKTVWEKRLKGPGAKSNSWSFMLLADGKIYVPN